MDNPSESLETLFRDIQQTRMAGIPILNPALSVQAVGFRPWENDWLGVLITPWFMNLILLPAEAQSAGLALGAKLKISFPSRDYTFMVNELDGIGRCLTHSLYSPMFMFTNQADALLMAEQALTNLGTADTAALAEEDAALDKYLNKEGMFERQEASAALPVAACKQARQVVAQPISRRDLLMGKFS